MSPSVTLDRPEALNAFIDGMEEALIQSFDRSPLRLPFSVGSG
jgi:enoyl-CoA hydratase/carnithine racemase